MVGSLTLALRGFSLAFLAWHGGLLFPGLAEPWFLAVAAVVGLVGGQGLKGLRGWLALPLGALAYGLARVVVGWLPLVSGTDASAIDALPLWFDRQMTFALLPFGLAWFEGWAFTDRPSRVGWERLVHAVAATLVFWSQGPYHVTLYPHPLALAAAYGLFLACELVLLVGKPPRTASWAAVLLVVVAGVAVLWTLLGRYEDQSTASGGGLMKPDLFQFDFAPLVRLEDEITLGENLVLLYREEGPARPRYLRRLVLNTWDPTRGFASTSGQGPVVGRRPKTLVPEGGTQGRSLVHQEYYLVNIEPSSLLTLNDPTSVTPLARWEGSSFVNAYRVDSLVAGEDFWLYNEQRDDGLTPAQRAAGIQGGDDPEIRALAQRVTKDATTAYEKATAVVLYLKDNYYYSLKPGSPGPRGALKHFLFEGKKGYCSYFAFSMTLMLRSLGIPARVAVGFATDPSTAVLGFTPVRAYQAHAWVEVPFGPYGWLEFDPTSDTPAPGEPTRFPKGSDAALSKMIAEILEAKPQALVDQPEPQATERPSWNQLWDTTAPSLPWLVLALLVGANEATRHRWRWARWRARDFRGQSRLWWRETVWRARRAGQGPHRGETPSGWASRLGDSELQALAADVDQARYDRGCPADLALRVARRAQHAGRRFDRHRPRAHRWAALVFPWWPR